MNLRAKHPSNREKLQRKIVKNGRRTNNCREGKKLLPFLYSSQCSWIWEQNIPAELQRKIVKYDRRTKNRGEEKKL